MPDVRDVSLDTFSGRIGEAFRLRADEGTVLGLELLEATALSDRPTATGRVPFSIVFTGPIQPALPQRIYGIDHDELGSFELFLVPVEPREGRARYEAVFA